MGRMRLGRPDRQRSISPCFRLPACCLPDFTSVFSGSVLCCGGWSACSSRRSSLSAGLSRVSGAAHHHRLSQNPPVAAGAPVRRVVPAPRCRLTAPGAIGFSRTGRVEKRSRPEAFIEPGVADIDKRATTIMHRILLQSERGAGSHPIRADTDPVSRCSGANSMKSHTCEAEEGESMCSA